MNIYYVYLYLRNQDSNFGAIGTPYYVGKGKYKRIFESRRHVPVPKQDEYFWIYADNLSEEDAHTLEIMLIARYGRIDIGTGILRNRTNGGEGASGHNRIPTEESRRKMSLSATGRKHSEETKRKISEANLNASEEVWNRRRRGAIGKKRPPVSAKRRKEMSIAIKNSKIVMNNISNLGKASKGSIWMHHPETKHTTIVRVPQLSQFIEQGYIKGRLMTEEHRRKFVEKKT